MKRSYRNIKRTSFLILALLTSFALAKSPRGVVSSVKGNVFVTSNQKTKKLDKGSYLYDFDEIFTEVGAELVFQDYFDHKYHVSGSSYVSLLNKIVELKSGYLWVQSMEETDDMFQVQTINSTVSYDHGEFIVSFDPDNGKSQILSIKGTHTINNNVYEFMKERIGPGRFSFFKDDYENGAPRVPTIISSGAYDAITSLFPEVTPMAKKTLMAKAPRHKSNKIKQEFYEKKLKKNNHKLTLREEMRISNNPGDLVIRGSKPAVANSNINTVIKPSSLSKRGIASVPADPNNRSSKLESYYNSKVRELASKNAPKKKKKFKPSYVKKSSVQVKIYEANLRVPASRQEAKDSKPAPKTPIVKPEPEVERKFRPAPNRNPASVQSPVGDSDLFEQSLKIESKKQQKHSDAVNSLINDLESYSQDYSESY